MRRMKKFGIGAAVKVIEKSDMYGKEGIVEGYNEKFYHDHLVRFKSDSPHTNAVYWEWFSGTLLELVKPRGLILMSEEPIFKGKSSDYETTPESVSVIQIRTRWYNEIRNEGFDMKKPAADLYNAMLNRAAIDVLHLEGNLVQLTESKTKEATAREAGWARELYKTNARNRRLYKSREYFKKRYAERHAERITATDDIRKKVIDMQHEIAEMKNNVNEQLRRAKAVIANENEKLKDQRKAQIEP